MKLIPKEKIRTLGARVATEDYSLLRSIIYCSALDINGYIFGSYAITVIIPVLKEEEIQDVKN